MHFDRAHLALVATSALILAAFGGGCIKTSDSSSTTSTSKTGTTTGTSSAGGAGQGGSSGGGAGQGGNAGGAGQGGSGPVVTPVLCPETNPYQPTLPNTVQITEPTLSNDATWTADKVYVVGAVLDPAGHKLTIEAGTTVCFYNNGGIEVGAIDGGAIIVKGTADKHVVFTATSDDGKKPNFWPGVGINQYKASEIHYLDIFFAGPGGGGSSFALEVHPTASGDGPLVLDHVVVSQVQSKGIQLQGWDKGVWDGIKQSDITFDGYYPVDADTPPLGAAFSFDSAWVQNLSTSNLHINHAAIPAESNYIDLLTTQGGAIAIDTTWHDLGVPYRTGADGISIIGDKAPGPTLTIDPGVVVQVRGDIQLGDLAAESYANLVAAGTDKAPVTFTSAEKAPAAGDWGTIYFVSGAYDAKISKLDHVTVEYGGNTVKTIQQCPGEGPVQGMVSVDGQGDYDGPAFTNSTFQHSASWGIAAQLNDGGKLKSDYGATNTFKDNKDGDSPVCK